MKKLSALSVRELTKVYPAPRDLLRRKKGRPFTAVNNISFDLAQGEILGLLGPNGAGKTTTIQMLLSVLKPIRGTITYFGKDLVAHRSHVLSEVAFASTYVKLPSRLSVMENLEVYGRLYGLDSATIRTRVQRFLKFFGVWEQRNSTTGSLSAGQTTRVMLAKAFLGYPRVALLDEPTASLDPDIAHEVRSFVQEQRREYGVSILYTSHNMDEVADICDRVLFLREGKIIANDTPDNLAASVSVTKVQLQVGDGLKRTISYAQANALPFAVEKRTIEITVDEQHIAELFMGIAQAGVHYSQISISKPNLEDYFLKTAHQSREENV